MPEAPIPTLTVSPQPFPSTALVLRERSALVRSSRTRQSLFLTWEDLLEQGVIAGTFFSALTTFAILHPLPEVQACALFLLVWSRVKLLGPIEQELTIDSESLLFTFPRRGTAFGRGARLSPSSARESKATRFGSLQENLNDTGIATQNDKNEWRRRNQQAALVVAFMYWSQLPPLFVASASYSTLAVTSFGKNFIAVIFLIPAVVLILAGFRAVVVAYMKFLRMQKFFAP